MSTASTLPTYSAVTSALKQTPGKFNASQVHGLFCALLCTNSSKDNSQWQKIVMCDEKNQKSQDILQELYENSYHQMSEFSFEFALLLPNDTKDINTRTEALGLWCQGFLAGLKQSHIRITHREPGEVTDALNDLTEIAQVTYGDIPASEEEETAYFELVEYVRLAILMIFHELKTDSLQKDPGENDLLH